jgi:LPXTG-site transpeptidase (sortase) family protein
VADEQARRTGIGRAIWGLVALGAIGVAVIATRGAAGGAASAIEATAAVGNASANDTTPADDATPSAIDPQWPVVQPPSSEDMPGGRPGDRIIISKLGVDAQIVTSRVRPGDDQMASPGGPDEVLFYDFQDFPGLGGYPGAGGNSILAGHVDYGEGPCRGGTVPPPCAAVFSRLGQLTEGDEVELRVGADVLRYRVSQSFEIDANDLEDKAASLLASSASETLTLVTCAGDFNRAAREYSARLFVTAVRVEE